MSEPLLQLTPQQVDYGLQKCAPVIEIHKEFLQSYCDGFRELQRAKYFTQTIEFIWEKVKSHAPYDSFTTLSQVLTWACHEFGHTLNSQLLCAALTRGVESWAGKDTLSAVDIHASIKEACQAVNSAAASTLNKEQILEITRGIEKDLDALDELEEFDFEQVFSALLISIQNYLAKNTKDSCIGVEMVITGMLVATLCDLCAIAADNLEGYTNIFMEMLQSLSAQRARFLKNDNQISYEQQFEVSFRIVTLPNAYTKIQSEIESVSSQVVSFYKMDAFGLAHWSICAHTSSVLSLCELSEVTSLRVIDLNPTEIAHYTQDPTPSLLKEISGGKVTLLTPRSGAQKTRKARKDVTEKESTERATIDLCPCTSLPALVQTLAQSSDRVLLRPTSIDLQWAGNETPETLLVSDAEGVKEAEKLPSNLILTQGDGHTLIVCEQLNAWLQNDPILENKDSENLLELAQNKAEQILKNCVSLNMSESVYQSEKMGLYVQRITDLLQASLGVKNAVLYVILGTDSASARRGDFEYILEQFPDLDLRLYQGDQSDLTQVVLWQG